MNYSGHRLAWCFRQDIPEPPKTAYATVIKHGNAIEPYRVIEEQEFRSEFAALLYGSQRCPQLPPYHYWTTEKRLILLP